MKSRKLKIGLIIVVIFLFGVIIGVTLYLLPESYKSIIILKGVVVTPDEIIDPGWVVVNDRRIESVSSYQPDIPKAIEIDTGGIILPGLINLHDHIVWNIIPRWNPDQVFKNRYEWRLGNEENKENSATVNGLRSEFFCQMNTYGEVRALVGGTTSIVGTANHLCIRGLVRNLDFLSGFYPLPIATDNAHIRNIIDLPSDVWDIEEFLESEPSEAFLIHLAEGVGPAMRAEFDQMERDGLLTDKTVIIHGVALSPEQYQRMSEEGASLIWSPRSNLELYGQTADIASAIEAGVLVAIGPDWAITGSSNILDELHLVDRWNATYLNGLLSDKQLVEMVTSNPAAIAGISDEVGRISEGKFADLLVISGDTSNPYRALIDANPKSVQLVLIDGIPVYGESWIMERFWDSNELSQIDITGTSKALRLSNFPDVVSDLELAISEYGFELAPITEDEEIDLSELVLDIEPETPPPLFSDTISWEDAVYFFGENMTVCGPVVNNNYADADDEVPSHLNIGQNYPNIDRFVVFIPQSARESFSDTPKDYYLNKDICVTGEIVSYQGVAEIVVTELAQITIP